MIKPILLAGCLLVETTARAATFASSDGARLHYERIGRGSDTVIYIHGGPGSNFRGQDRAMRMGVSPRTLILYDQRGSGLSEVIADPARLTLDQHVADLEALRSQLKLKQFTIVALSWGAAIATRYAAEHPERVRRMILVSPLPPTRATFDERLRHLQAQLPARERDQLAKLREDLPSASDAEARAICRKLIRLTIGVQYLARPTPVKVAEAQRRCDIPAAAIRNRPNVESAGIASLGHWDFRPEMRRITIPVLVMEGSESRVPLDATRLWAATLPHSRFLLIPAAGHELFLDQPKLFATAVRSFLAGEFPRRARQLARSY